MHSCSAYYPFFCLFSFLCHSGLAISQLSQHEADWEVMLQHLFLLTQHCDVRQRWEHPAWCHLAALHELNSVCGLLESYSVSTADTQNLFYKNRPKVHYVLFKSLKKI